jgi:dephospho-CoA kinase
VKRVLITGMSGTGKSTLLDELAACGHRAVDTDYGDYFHLVDGERLWREDRRASRQRHRRGAPAPPLR